MKSTISTLASKMAAIIFKMAANPFRSLLNIAIYVIFYWAYRNSGNNAFLRLFRYVRTNRTMTIKI